MGASERQRQGWSATKQIWFPSMSSSRVCVWCVGDSVFSVLCVRQAAASLNSYLPPKHTIKRLEPLETPTLFSNRSADNAQVFTFSVCTFLVNSDKNYTNYIFLHCILLYTLLCIRQICFKFT